MKHTLYHLLSSRDDVCFDKTAAARGFKEDNRKNIPFSPTRKETRNEKGDTLVRMGEGTTNLPSFSFKAVLCLAVARLSQRAVICGNVQELSDAEDDIEQQGPAASVCLKTILCRQIIQLRKTIYIGIHEEAGRKNKWMMERISLFTFYFVVGAGAVGFLVFSFLLVVINQLMSV